MDKLKKYGFNLNESNSKAVKQVEKLLTSYYKDEDKLKKMYSNRFSVAVDSMISVEEMNQIVNQLDFNDEMAGDLMVIMANKARELNMLDDFEGEF